MPLLVLLLHPNNRTHIVKQLIAGYSIVDAAEEELLDPFIHKFAVVVALHLHCASEFVSFKVYCDDDYYVSHALISARASI